MVIFSLMIPVSFALAECGNPTSAKELLDCVLKNDPRILVSAEQIKRAEARARAFHGIGGGSPTTIGDSRCGRDFILDHPNAFNPSFLANLGGTTPPDR